MQQFSNIDLVTSELSKCGLFHSQFRSSFRHTWLMRSHSLTFSSSCGVNLPTRSSNSSSELEMVNPFCGPVSRRTVTFVPSKESTSAISLGTLAKYHTISPVLVFNIKAILSPFSVEAQGKLGHYQNFGSGSVWFSTPSL